jgi:hypothetical protein
MFGLEVVGHGEEHAGESARGDVAAVGVRAALVDVLVQKVDRDSSAPAPALQPSLDRLGARWSRTLTLVSDDGQVAVDRGAPGSG